MLSLHFFRAHCTSLHTGNGMRCQHVMERDVGGDKVCLETLSLCMGFGCEVLFWSGTTEMIHINGCGISLPDV